MRKMIGCCAIAAVFLALAAGCGGEQGTDLPPGVIAKVGDDAITRAALDRVIVGQVAIKNSAGAQPPYWASDIDGCVATQGRRPATRDLSPAELKQRCERERDRARTAAVRLLIQGRWYEREARRQHVAIPVPNGLAAVSAHSGVDQKYLAEAQRILLVRGLVGPRWGVEPPPFPRAALVRHYESDREHYRSSAQQLIEAVLAPTPAQARAMAAQLRRGRPARELARQYKNRGIKLPFTDNLLSTLAAGNARLVKMASRVRKGEVAVLKERRGWFVFKVVVDRPAEQLSFDEARSNVALDLWARRGREDVEAYNAKLRSRYQDDTVCARGYEVPECKS